MISYIDLGENIRQPRASHEELFDSEPGFSFEQKNISNK